MTHRIEGQFVRKSSKQRARKRPWFHLKWHLEIFLVGLRKITINISQSSRSLGLDLSSGLPKYEHGY